MQQQDNEGQEEEQEKQAIELFLVSLDGRYITSRPIGGDLDLFDDEYELIFTDVDANPDEYNYDDFIWQLEPVLIEHEAAWLLKYQGNVVYKFFDQMVMPISEVDKDGRQHFNMFGSLILQTFSCRVANYQTGNVVQFVTMSKLCANMEYTDSKNTQDKKQHKHPIKMETHLVYLKNKNNEYLFHQPLIHDLPSNSDMIKLISLTNNDQQPTLFRITIEGNNLQIYLDNGDLAATDYICANSAKIIDGTPIQYCCKRNDKCFQIGCMKQQCGRIYFCSWIECYPHDEYFDIFVEFPCCTPVLK